MLILDAHQDIAYNALAFDRDYRQSALVHRRREAGLGYAAATLGLPDAMLGCVGLVFATMFTAPESTWDWSVPGHSPVYRTPQGAYEQAMHQLDYYHRIADSTDKVQIITRAAELDAVLASWGEGRDIPDHRQGLVLLMEGADPIIEPRQFEEWYERGVRIVGPAWQATRYSAGTGAPGPLSRLGYELLEVMASFNAILDLSHMAERAYMQALDAYEGVIIASHSNPRRFVDTDRHLSDDMIRRLAERDGVMGVVLYNRFLHPRWQSGDPKSKVPMSTVVAVIDHICQLTGSAAHVGIGSDLDGGFGAESIPEGLDSVMDLLEIASALREHGYDEADIEAIMGGNMLRKLRMVLD